MSFTATVHGERFDFGDLATVMARANEEKSGDALAGVAARSDRERVAAKIALADVPLRTLVATPLIDPETDEVSRLILAQHDADAFAPIASLTVGELREWLLDERTTEHELRAIHRAITPETAAAVAKLMGNKDLVIAARKVRTITRCRSTMGGADTLGVRLQPNHPTDDLAGIVVSTLDGLLMGCGDAVIGVNPAIESVETVAGILRGLGRMISTLEIPTQSCVLAHVTTQLAAMERGAPVDILFQSIAGSEKANASFGVSLALLGDGMERVREHHAQRVSDGETRFAGGQFMYFETGQGSALSAEAHHGLDQLTMEARAYGVARAFDPFLVNSVVGFIGPEYLYDERQIVRAGLEDHFVGKLLGLPMGCDVCYTNHAEADQNTVDNALVLLATAGVTFVMGVPCGDDVMLSYQSTSFHDALGVRGLLGRKPAPEFVAWLEAHGIFRDGVLSRDVQGARRMLAERTVPLLGG